MGSGETERVAVVTGATAGIGRATADLLVERGYRVAAVARRGDRLEAMASARLKGYVCDITDRPAARATIAAVGDEFGRIDALVNNAGVTGNGPLDEVGEERIGLLIDTNVRGAIAVAQAAIPALKASRGAIVNVGSTAVVRPVPNTAVYAATKGALEALTRALAYDLALDGVRVNAVSPALVDTELLAATGMQTDDWDGYLRKWGDGYPLGRAGRPSDVASLIAYLLSAKAAWMTGVAVTIDGGHSVGQIEPQTAGRAP